MNANGLHRAGSSRRSLGLGLEARGTPGLPATAATTIVGLSAGMVGGASVASGSPRVGVGAASAALTFPAIPGADNIKSLILQKERELHEMTERRIATLEKSMKEKVWLGLALLRELAVAGYTLAWLLMAYGSMLAGT